MSTSQRVVQPCAALSTAIFLVLRRWKREWRTGQASMERCSEGWKCGGGGSGTKASFRLTSRLNSADLPAFGGPVMATTGRRGSSRGTLGSPFRLELGLKLLTPADAAVCACATLCRALPPHARAALNAASSAVRMHKL